MTIKAGHYIVTSLYSYDSFFWFSFSGIIKQDYEKNI